MGAPDPPRQDRFQSLRLGDGPSRSLLRVGLFPTLLIGGVIAAVPLFDRFDPFTVGLAMYLGTIPLFFFLERMIPWSEGWIGSRGDVSTDVGLVVLAGAATPILGPATQLTAVALAAGIGMPAEHGLWPAGWPVIVQGALALVFADFFRYWVHRALHEVPFLWRIHATHHSAPRLYFFNGARLHPLEILVSGFVETTPLLLLGVTPEALAMRFVMGRVIGRFQHCNLDVSLGPLDYLFSTPKNHRWHHSKNLQVAAHNYGGDVIVWDHVFGTFFLPTDREPSDQIGIENMPCFPTDLVGVLLSPWRWRAAHEIEAVTQE